MDPKIIFYIAFGLALLGLTWLPSMKGSRFINIPLLYFILAAILFSQALGLPTIDPVNDKLHTVITEYVTEIIVIVSLAGTGLAIDRKFRFQTWQSTFRLLCVSMPISMASAALLGHWIFGLPLADAMLLGACLAPTDPVMAHSVQVGAPNEGGEDPVRFSLTTEAGLNDGLAFPFVYLAIRISEHDGLGSWLVKWAAYDFTYRVAMGIAVGIGIGWLLGHYVFRVSDESWSEDTQEGLFVVAAIFLSYGFAELLHGYGFLAVFAAAVAGRQNVNKDHEYHRKPHQFATQLERIFAGLLLLALGGFVAQSDLSNLLSWQNFLFALLFMLAVRPLSGFLSLRGLKIRRSERWAIAFFGIRGFGSFYYLAYAQTHASFDNIGILWSIITLTVLTSLLLHGNTATLAMGWLDGRRGSKKRRRQKSAQRSA
ncbi:MAG: cation:proton antiporter [Phormidesmis sp.]